MSKSKFFSEEIRNFCEEYFTNRYEQNGRWDSRALMRDVILELVEEEFRDVTKLEGYYKISNFGRLRSVNGKVKQVRTYGAEGEKEERIVEVMRKGKKFLRGHSSYNYIGSEFSVSRQSRCINVPTYVLVEREFSDDENIYKFIIDLTRGDDYYSTFDPARKEFKSWCEKIKTHEEIIEERRLTREIEKERRKREQEAEWEYRRIQLIKRKSFDRYLKILEDDDLSRFVKIMESNIKKGNYKKLNKWIRVCTRLYIFQEKEEFANDILLEESKIAEKILGCNRVKFKEYIENKFTPSQSWDNYGIWHFDHIIPTSKFNMNDINYVWLSHHYTNVQPLNGYINEDKGNTLPYGFIEITEDFEDKYLNIINNYDQPCKELEEEIKYMINEESKKHLFARKNQINT